MLENQVYEQFVNDFSTKIYNLKSEEPFSDYIFLCVGSDKIIGDAFGPLVGNELNIKLKNFYNNIKIQGTLDNPITGENLEYTVKNIYENYKNPCIIAIDAALSTNEDVGSIIVTNSKMKFGKSTNQKMIEVGDISIKGIVAKNHNIARYNFAQLQNTSLNTVIKLAKTTANGIYDVIKYKS